MKKEKCMFYWKSIKSLFLTWRNRQLSDLQSFNDHSKWLDKDINPIFTFHKRYSDNSIAHFQLNDFWNMRFIIEFSVEKILDEFGKEEARNNVFWSIDWRKIMLKF